MKSKILLLTLLVIFCDINAQETDALTLDLFLNNLNERIQSGDYSKGPVINMVLNTEIEDYAMDSLYEKYRRDSLESVRNLMQSVFYTIASDSKQKSSRTKAINYLFDFALEPSIDGLFLADFDDTARQKIIKFFNKQYTEEEFSFFVESRIKDDMRAGKRWYDHTIEDSIKKYHNTISYGEVWERIFWKEASVYREKILNTPPVYHNLLIASQLNIREVIPYLKEYVANDKYDAKTKEYAIYALACSLKNITENVRLHIEL
jgi:hypothetical protein